MRLSVDKDDPGYRPDAGGGRWRVLFNGKDAGHFGHIVITADEELGRLVRYRTDDNGRMVVYPATRLPIRDNYLGDVRIIDTQPPRAHSSGPWYRST